MALSSNNDKPIRGSWGFLVVGFGLLFLAGYVMLQNNTIKVGSRGDVKVDTHEVSWDVEHTLSITAPKTLEQKTATVSR